MKIYSNGKMLEINGGSSMENIYSTEEQVVGRWIDGKPLYHRVYLATSPNAVGANDYNILNLDESIFVWKIDGMLLASDGSIIPVNFSHLGTAKIACWFKENLHCIYMQVGVSVQTNVPVYLYLTYTKTTDAASTPTTIEANGVSSLNPQSLHTSAMPVTAVPTEQL